MLFVLGCYISVFLWVPRCMPHDPQIFGVVGGIGAVVGLNKTIPPITRENVFQQFVYFLAEANTCIGASWRKQGASDAQADLDHIGGRSWRVFFSAVEQGKCTFCNSGEHLGRHSCGTPHFGNVLSVSSLASVLQPMAWTNVTNMCFEVQVSIRRLGLQVSKLGVEVEIAVSLRRADIFHEKYKFRRSET